MKYRVNVCALLAGAVACTGSQWTPPDPPAPRDATPVAASFAATWNAAIDVFADRNISIKTIDRASGLIVAEAMKVGHGQPELADCGKGEYGEIYEPSDANWNLIIRGDSTRSTVKATVRFLSVAEPPLPPSSVECSSRGIWETQLEQRVKASAESKK